MLKQFNTLSSFWSAQRWQRGITPWNDSQLHFRQANSLIVFKACLKNTLLFPGLQTSLSCLYFNVLLSLQSLQWLLIFYLESSAFFGHSPLFHDNRRKPLEKQHFWSSLFFPPVFQNFRETSDRGCYGWSTRLYYKTYAWKLEAPPSILCFLHISLTKTIIRGYKSSKQSNVECPCYPSS